MRVRNVVGSLCKILYALRVLSRRKRCACQESCRITVQTLYVLGILLRHYANIVHASASSCSASTLTSGGCGKATKIGVVVGVYAGKLHNDEWVAIKKLRQRDTNSADQSHE
ncbi:hypothetical protein JHK86_030298 [Glycine max]|nr:hypothetical protein JHK86_030298 [Glycine max]